MPTDGVVRVPIDSVSIGRRGRKELGDLASLAKSIDHVGLLHPLVLTADRELICGRRRLEACKKLGWKQVPARLLDLDDLLAAERDENTCRKDFLPTELVAIGEAIEKREKEKAKQRQEASRPKKGEKIGSRQGAGNLPAPSVKSADTRDKVASALGVSGKTYEKAKAVVTAAGTDPSLKPLADQMDETGKVDAAYRELQRRQHLKFREETAAKTKLPSKSLIRAGDFRTCLSDLPDGSVQLIFVDPPYDRQSVPLYGDLAKFAARVLADGGSLVCYAGHHVLPDLFRLMTPHIEYRWCFCVRHTAGQQRVHKYEVSVGWKPLLWFAKGSPRRANKNYLRDLIDSTLGDKAKHDWAQGHDEAAYLIENLTVPGELVVDPMCGSGTTVAAALRLGRKALGAEIDEARAKVACAGLPKA